MIHNDGYMMQYDSTPSHYIIFEKEKRVKELQGMTKRQQGMGEKMPNIGMIEFEGEK